MIDGYGVLRQVHETVHDTAAKHGIFRRFGTRDSLVDGGMASLAMVDLMFAIESGFDLVIPDHELTAGNFATTNNIAMMLSRLLGLQSGQDPEFPESTRTTSVSELVIADRIAS